MLNRFIDIFDEVADESSLTIVFAIGMLAVVTLGALVTAMLLAGGFWALFGGAVIAGGVEAMHTARKMFRWLNSEKREAKKRIRIYR